MKPTLLGKFFISYILVIVVSFILIFTFSSASIESFFLKKTKDTLFNTANMISELYATNYYNGTLSLKNLTSDLTSMSTFLNIEIWLVDKNGNVTFSTRKQSNYLHTIKITDYNPYILDNNTTALMGTFNDLFFSDTLSVSQRINIDYDTRGYVILHTSLSDINSTKNYVSRIGITTFMIILFFSFIILYTYAKDIIHPLNLMNKAAKQYAEGNFDYQLSINSNDEIGELANSLNHMSIELNKIDEYRNAFIANISHDFRSPLTSIKGYAEAIIDGTIPYESQTKYLEIVLFEAERLNKLTGNLLTLNNYDTTGLVLDFRNFDINSLIKHILLTFERACTNKKIKFKLVTSDKLMFVNADIDKTQQVLYNLIDNAIKFSSSNSSITLETTYAKNNKIEITIRDTGIGIPYESLKHIWERFYKSDLSRGKDKQGTGLGLAIIKDIIKAHGEEITVSSEEDKYTEFKFTLARAKSKS